MPETLTSGIRDEKNKLHNTKPWVWLLELQNVDDSEAVRIAGYDRNFTYEGDVYYAFPMQIGIQRRDGKGELADIEIQVSSIGGFVVSRLEDDGLLDQQVIIRLVHEDHPTEKVHEGTYIVKEATVNASTAVFVCGHYDLFAASLPAQRYNRTRCRHIYGGAGCAYDTTLPNAIAVSNPDFDPTTCDLTRDGTNGCRVHGENETANGKTPLHPQLFGGFPGIPKGPARV